MRYLILFMVFTGIVGGSIHTRIVFSGEATTTLRMLVHSFGSVGYKFEPETVSVENNAGEIRGTITGNRTFNPAAFGESLKEQMIRIEKAHLDSAVLELTLDTQNSIWNLPLLGKDEGIELRKVTTTQWFRVEEGQTIRIQAPYGSDWYPDIAVFNTEMKLLLSVHTLEPKGEYRFDLPPEAYYLKISNSQGMKVLREGMWIESMSPGR
ncbi:MAG: hypothetical protein PHW64_05555 [Sulfuricurvum sp.]|nr:hypothetical protein [Sulfuricurvum sp.]